MWPSPTDEIYEFLEEIEESVQDLQKEIKEMSKKLDRLLLLHMPPSVSKN